MVVMFSQIYEKFNMEDLNLAVYVTKKFFIESKDIYLNMLERLEVKPTVNETQRLQTKFTAENIAIAANPFSLSSYAEYKQGLSYSFMTVIKIL